MASYGSSSTANSTIVYDTALLLVRITVSCLIMSHGLQKLTMLLGPDEVQFPDPLGIGPVPSLILAIFAEVVCSFLIILGFATKLSCIPLIVTMLIIVFNVHSADPFEAKELPIMYLLLFIVFFVTGAGKFSVDYLIKKKKPVNY
ncbi:DoxX family protein [Flavobacterium album]|uniref:DoxX family protein n=1 Tax=Flavobacterium album TaxID=2175091 RepID=A0A2S1QY18_9FLAO|nr:DoxX family protein [Flavobacterium album]AWH85293.1 DoxX family protein [Flavobacterium album]